ncbi:MAG: penicillin acylase family protein [Bacteroidales bacterium]
MKTIERILVILLAVVVLVVFAGSIFLGKVKKSGIPDYNADVQLTGLTEPVEVMRDSLGIPHVYASNEHDLYLSVGYLMAQDRLWQMDLLRRLTTGRLSEIFGESMLENDHLLRALRYTEKSRRIMDSCSAEIMACLTAFSEGVNQYINQHPDGLPPEFRILGYKPEPWEPVYSLNLVGYMAWDLKSGWSEIMLEEVRAKVGDSLCNQLIPQPSWYSTVVYPDYKPQIAQQVEKKFKNLTEFIDNNGLDIFNGSNNWAVSGSKTASGKPMLANDMHLGLNIPGIWYQMHQVIPGKLDVTGLVLPGQPIVIAGHNDSIAWGMTNTYVDNVDFYLETVNPSNPDQYKFNGEWRDIQVKKELIKDKAGKTHERELRFTHRGAIVSGFKGFGDKVVSLHWVGDEYSNEFRTVYLLNRAGNWNDFTTAISTFLAVSQNIVYADVKGNIGLYFAAGIPLRKQTGNIGFLPGDTDEYDWKGFVPTPELPHVFNPQEGFVSSANNRTVGDQYPYYIGRWFSTPYRQQRIRELLQAGEKMTMEDFMKIQTDEKSKMAEEMIPAMLQALDRLPDPAAGEKKAIGILKSWDFEMHANSAAAAIFESTYQNLIPVILKDEMGDELYTKYFNNTGLPKFALYYIWRNPSSAWCDDISTRDITETLEVDIQKSFRKSMEQLTNLLGPDPDSWTWGAIHTLTLEHPLSKAKILDKLFGLNRGPFPVGGSFHTVRPYSYDFEKAFKSAHGASHRHIFDLSDWNKSLTVIPTGNSGIPSSPFYCNQTNMYVHDQYHADVIARELVEKKAMTRMKFIP